MGNKVRGAIAAGHVKTAEAGQRMFAEGGNAFDAAVAAVLASFVAEPGLTSPAGGGFLLAQTQDHDSILFDFFTQTPRNKRPAAELDFHPIHVNFGDALQTFHIGLGSIAVPGNIAGLLTVQEQLGKLPLSIVAEPAIEYATQGIEITPFQATSLNLLQPILILTAESQQLFAPQGKLLQVGDRFSNPALANTLEEVVREGARAFYAGAIAQQLVRDCQENGGLLTHTDLEQYEVILRQPLHFRYRGHDLLTNPPPSSGGVLIAFALKLLEGLDLTNLKFGSTTHYQLLTQVMSLTNTAREEAYHKNSHRSEMEAEFLEAEYLYSFQQHLNKWGSTTHVSTIDAEGNAASVTTSNGEGSAYLIPGTGIMMNNMLGEADLNPTGFHQWEVNQRLSSMMSPTILLQQQTPAIVLGSGGSNRIRTAILQVLANLIDFQMSIAEAVTAPRVHWEAGLLNIEPPYDRAAASHPALQELTQCLLWQQQSMFFGGVHAVVREVDQRLSGAGDPRRGGAVLAQM
jgi:gamma-glutamyltranspeptidase / glutathione hydrolase